MMDEEMIKTLVKVIDNNIRHPYYERVKELKEVYTALITGVHMEGLMRRFDIHESEEAFKQRKRITTHITSTVSRNLMKPIYKIPRSNSVQRVIRYDNDSTDKKANELEAILSKFWEDGSLDNWFNSRFIDLSCSDPNAWCVLEWNDFDPTTEKAKPYPFEVSSDNAIYYSKNVKGELQYLITKHTVYDEFGENPKDRYTMYGKDKTLVFTSVKKQKNYINTGDIFTDEDGNEIIKTRSSGYFIVNNFTHNLGFVPAFVVGFNRDVYTNGNTMLSILDDAVPILLKIVKANSELDLTAALHVFPQKIQYANRCDANGCNGGFLPDGKKCEHCGGTGYKVHRTAQDIIYIRMPKDKDDMLPLDNIIKYVSPSVELVKWQDEYIQQLTIRCKEALYNSELFSKKEVSETATGKNIDLQNVYDSLYGVAMAYSTRWKFCVESISKITDTNEGLECYYKFSKDFKMKSLTDLYNDLATVATGNADSFVKDGIQDDIAGILWSEDKVALDKHKTLKFFFPFSGKSEKEIMFAITNEYVPKEVKTLYLNYGWIFDYLYNQNNNFYQLPRDAQKQLIDDKVSSIISESESQTQIDTQNDITAGDTGQE